MLPKLLSILLLTGGVEYRVQHFDLKGFDKKFEVRIRVIGVSSIPISDPNLPPLVDIQIYHDLDWWYIRGVDPIRSVVFIGDICKAPHVEVALFKIYDYNENPKWFMLYASQLIHGEPQWHFKKVDGKFKVRGCRER